MVIKAFIFDYGGVITAGGGANALSTDLAEALQIPAEQAADLLIPRWNQFVRGQVTEAAFWQAMEQEYGQPITEAQRDIWQLRGMEPLNGMVSLVRRLRDQGYVVGMVSNIIPVTAGYLRDLGVYDDFDFVILSYEAGYAKPDPEIYAIALKQLGNVRPDEVVFLDDQERCLAPARELGIQTILVEDAAQATADVDKLLGDDHAH